jgi:stress response protein SCP2
MIAMYKLSQKINVAIGLAIEAGKAILEMKQMLFFPFLSLFKLIALFVYFVFIAMYIASAANLGDVKEKAQYGYQEAVNKIKESSPDNWKMVKELHVGNTTSPAHLDGSPIIRSMLAYHTVGMWWTALVIIALAYYTVSRAIAEWYFNEGKYKESNKKWVTMKEEDMCNLICCKVNCQKEGESPVINACKRGCSQHLGSLAAGAALSIAAFFARILMFWINWITNRLSSGHPIAKKIKACVFCCSILFDKFVRIISRNAYIMLAIKGNSFCTSAEDACWLIFAASDDPMDRGLADYREREKNRKLNGEGSKPYTSPYKKKSYNAMQYAVLSFISDILLFLGKLCTIALVGIASYIWVDTTYTSTTMGGCVETAENRCKTQLNSTLMPVIVSCLFAYFITSAFMAVYELSIDTVLLCYFFDKEINKGGPYAMSSELKKLVNDNLETYNPMDMRAGDSFFFSQAISEEGVLSFGLGWDTSVTVDQGSGQKVQQDLDLALVCYDKDAQLLDYIGFYPATDPRTGQSGLLAKSKAGGKLFKFNPNSPISNLTVDQIFSSQGDDRTGKNDNNDAGINESIKIRLSKLPMNVHTIAVCAFVFKGGMMNQVKDLCCRCTEDIRNPEKNRKPTIVAQFNMDFKTTDEGKAIEGNQKSILFAKVRRDNPEGNTDPTKSTWELEAQRHLMDAKMFNDSVFNAIANKCFFWRDAGADGKKKKAGGYAGMVLSAGAAMVANA